MLFVSRTPDRITPAFNEMLIDVQSDEQYRSDFRYIIELLDESFNTIGRLKKVGNADTTYTTTIDVSGLVASFQNFDQWRYNVQGGDYIYFDDRFVKTFYIAISEYYDSDYQDATGWQQKTTPSALSLPKFGTNFMRMDLALTDPDGQGLWMHNFRSYKLRRTDKLTLTYLCCDYGLQTMFYNFYDADGNLIYVKQVFFNQLPNWNELGKSLNATWFHAGFKEVCDFTAIDPALIDQVSFYSLVPANDRRIPGEPIFIYLQCRNQKHPGVLVHFLNEWGGVDPFLFDLALTRKVKTEKKLAKFTRPQTDLRPTNYGFNNMPYRVTFTDSLKLTSNYVSEVTANALQCLFTSPIINVEVDLSMWWPQYFGAGQITQILPADVSAKSYEVKTKAISKMFNIELDADIAIDNTRQTL